MLPLGGAAMRSFVVSTATVATDVVIAINVVATATTTIEGATMEIIEGIATESTKGE